MSISRLTTNGLTGTKYDTVSADNYYMEPIATSLLSSATGTITFSNIPQGYKHLQIRYLARHGAAITYAAWVYGQFNGDTGSNYVGQHSMVGRGDGVVYAQNVGATTVSYLGEVAGGNGVANTFCTGVVDILDYANNNKFKTIRSLSGDEGQSTSSDNDVRLMSSLWMNTAPITSITLSPSSSTFSTYSRFSLYGIKG